MLDLSKHLGLLMVELDTPSSIRYCGMEGYLHGGHQLEPHPDSDETRNLFVLSPPAEAPRNQMRRHRYLIQYDGGDVYVRHPVYKSFTLVEHRDLDDVAAPGDVAHRCWELTLDGLDARIVMPPDFRMCEQIQDS